MHALKVFGFLALIMMGLNSWAYIPVRFEPKVPDMNGCPGTPCSCSCNDPYDPRVISIAGKSAGKCLDTCTFRTATILPENDINYAHELSKEEYVQAVNVVYNDSFYLAKIPLKGIKETIVQIEWFGLYPANHFQVRFRFNQPVQLIKQDGTNSEVFLHDDFIWTVNGLGPVRMWMGLPEALSGQVVSGYLFSATHDWVNNAAINQKHNIYQHSIDLTPQESGDLLKGLLELGTRESYNLVFNLGENSCVSKFYSVFDNILEPAKAAKSKEILNKFLVKKSRTVPSNSIYYLKKLGVYKEKLPTIKKEFNLKY